MSINENFVHRSSYQSDTINDPSPTVLGSVLKKLYKLVATIGNFVENIFRFILPCLFSKRTVVNSRTSSVDTTQGKPLNVQALRASSTADTFDTEENDDVGEDQEVEFDEEAAAGCSEGDEEEVPPLLDHGQNPGQILDHGQNPGQTL